LKAASNEWGCLAQGNIHSVTSTNTIDFIHKSDIPSHTPVTYVSVVCSHKPLKKEQHRVRVVVGGNKLDYLFETASPAAGLLETKLLLNSIISDVNEGAKFFSMDLSDFFLATPMSKPEYMKVPIKYFPPDIITLYNLHDKAHNDHINIKIKRTCMDLNKLLS